jgi:hypothetical protein
MYRLINREATLQYCEKKSLRHISEILVHVSASIGN